MCVCESVRVCVGVRVCVWEREREREREKGGVENKSSSFLFHLGFIEYLLNLLQVQWKEEKMSTKVKNVCAVEGSKVLINTLKCACITGNQLNDLAIKWYLNLQLKTIVRSMRPARQPSYSTSMGSIRNFHPRWSMTSLKVWKKSTSCYKKGRCYSKAIDIVIFNLGRTLS